MKARTAAGFRIMSTVTEHHFFMSISKFVLVIVISHINTFINFFSEPACFLLAMRAIFAQLLILLVVNVREDPI